MLAGRPGNGEVRERGAVVRLLPRRFEEWSTRAGGIIPEPSAALVFSLGMLVTGAKVRRVRR